MARVATLRASAGDDDGFYRAKRLTAEFYYARILPRTRTHAAAIRAGARTIMSLDEPAFLV
jgi:hypothetical protein